MSAKEYSFDTPETFTAGVTRIDLVNNGGLSHQAQIARLNPGVTAEQYEAAANNGPGATAALAVGVGGPNAQVPNGSADAYADLTAGQYVFVCNVRDPDGLSHSQKGMVKGFTVTAGTAPSTVKLPETNLTINQREYSFDNPATLPSGQTTVTVQNAGTQPHEMALVKLQPGVTLDQVKTSFTANPPPASRDMLYTSAGGVGAIDAGTSTEVTLNLSSGNYAFICFITDPNLKKQHAALGMVSGFTVP